MTMSFNVKALGAFKKLTAAALITATLAMFFVACKQTSGGTGGGKQGAPFVEGGASLILSPDNLTIKVRARTEDGSAITVEGCTETTLANDTETELHAKGTSVVLKGKITELNCSDNKLTELNVQGLTKLQVLHCYYNQLPELNVQGLTALQKLDCFYNELTELNVQGLTKLQVLHCYYNKLTELNVQGLTSLQVLYCDRNKLNAEAMTKLLNALPAREASDDAKGILYNEEAGEVEGNCKDFTQSEDLKKAFDEAKGTKHWALKKHRYSIYSGWSEVDI